MTYASWGPRHRVVTVPPGKVDLLVVTLIDGVRAHVDPIISYDAVVARAQAFHRDHPCQIKVLPMTGPEARRFLGINLPGRPQPVDAAVQQQMIAMLLQVARESSDPDARADALKLLTGFGEVAY